MRSVAGTALFAMGIAFDTMMDISRHSSARYSRGRRLCWPRRLSRADFVQYHRSFKDTMSTSSTVGFE